MVGTNAVIITSVEAIIVAIAMEAGAGVTSAPAHSKDSLLVLRQLLQNDLIGLFVSMH